MNQSGVRDKDQAAQAGDPGGEANGQTVSAAGVSVYPDSTTLAPASQGGGLDLRRRACFGAEVGAW